MAFWQDIAPSVQRLDSSIVETDVPDVGRELVKDLKTAIAAALATPPTTRQSVEDLYKKYAALYVLWDQRETIDELVEPAKSDLTRLLELADMRIWQQLKGDSTLKIRLPVLSNPDGLQEYDTLQFSLETGDAELEQSFLFRHKIECHWKLTLTAEATDRTGDAAAKIVLMPVSLGPSIVQYFPRQGSVSVCVTIRYRGETRDLPPVDGLVIRKSSDYAVYNILARTEMVSWLLAALVAIANGLSTYYFKGTSWGTFQDYLTLFLWGRRRRPGKNFLQALQLYGSPTAATTAH